MSVDTAPPPKSRTTISPVRRTSAHGDLQAIDAEYYNITDANGSPLAGLIVLLDRKSRPVRAELHVGESIAETEREMALRQAHLLLRDRYFGTEPLRFYVLRSALEHQSSAVELDAPPPPSRLPHWTRPVAAGLVALFVFLALGWFLNDLLTGDAEPEATAPPAVVDTAPTQPGAAPAVDNAAPAAPAADTAGADNVERIFETNNLPVSVHAIPMDQGQRARIRPGYSLTIRTEPGAESGTVAGYLQNGEEMTLVNGPVWLQGLTDTIVWWYVRLDDGTEGWVPANTSELTLLEPVG